jgi:hypothetical protein
MSTLNASDFQSPYLSVVVTTRNDDHGGDPLKRLQAFVNCFEAQCRRTHLDAELIVVEWNPPPDRPRVSSLLHLPAQPTCSYRFIVVPGDLHHRLAFADVLPLFQMIAKNVGIRRARGRFILATNIDIIFSNELIEYIATRQLQLKRFYRVDRHDIRSDFPVGASLEDQMAFCASHQLRVHSRLGTVPVDPQGQPTGLTEDIVDGTELRLGAGWHVRESAGPGRPFRWASDRAMLLVGRSNVISESQEELELDVESNPYDPTSWVEVAAVAGERTLASARVVGRTRVTLPLGGRGVFETVELRVVNSAGDVRSRLPAFERRDLMQYRVYSVKVRTGSADPARLIERRPTAGARGLGRAFRTETTLARARERISRMADGFARLTLAMLGRRLRAKLVRASPEFAEVRASLQASDEQLRELASLREFAGFSTFLRDRRPDNLHTNACGDFQLMARIHWDELRAYPEFETFSMNIDGLFSYIADAGGVTEQILDMPIYHLEHEIGSGWSPEGEAKLRKRIAESGITWLDATTVYIWAAYMRWLGRPMIFNGQDWGLASTQLPEYNPSPSSVGS